MKVEILIFIGLMQNANAFYTGNAEDGAFKDCVTHIANKLFENDYYVHVITDKSDSELHYGIRQPKIIWNVNVTNETNKIQNPLIAKSMMIEVEHWKNLEKAIIYLRKCRIWDRVETPRGTFLVIIPVEEVKITFELLWKYFVHNAVVLVINDLKVYQSNPQIVENGCGKSANVVHVQNCDGIQILFKKGYRKYSGCTVGLRKPTLHKQGAVSKRHLLSNATVDVLIKKFQVIVYDDANGTQRNSFGISVYFTKYPVVQFSQIVTREKVVVVLPLPNRISPLMIFVSIFQMEVWIMVTCGFFITIFFYAILLAWHGTPITFTTLSLLNIQTLSLTLWGCCAPFSKHFSIRYLLVFYIFYSIVVQTGYVSQLIRVITIPQYERQVDNLAELADSPIPFCSTPLCVFSRIEIGEKLLEKLLYPMLNGLQENETVSSIIQTYNCSLGMREDDAVFYFSKEPMIPNKILFDPDGGVHFAYAMGNGDYFLDTLNQAITSLKENGVYAKIDKDITIGYRKALTQFSHPDEPQVLTVHHLRGLFIIWAFCLGISFLVFILEILIHLSFACCASRRINHVEPAVIEQELRCVDVE